MYSLKHFEVKDFLLISKNAKTKQNESKNKKRKYTTLNLYLNMLLHYSDFLKLINMSLKHLTQ